MKREKGVPEAVRRRVLDEVVRSQPARRRAQSAFYLGPGVRKKGSVVTARHQRIEVLRDTIVVFADDQPMANWAHACRYLLHDADSGALYRTVDARFPPGGTVIPKDYEVILRPPFDIVRDPGIRIEMPRYICPRRREHQRYAILFSGDSNNRHVNDLEFLYRTLIDVYDFDDDKIYVLNHDGTINYDGSPHPVGNWPGDNTPYRMTVTGEGNRANLDGAIDDLKGRIKANDTLLIHTNNHGWNDGTNSLLCLRNDDDYAAPDFAAKLEELSAFAHLMVMMEQCNSGGFIQPILYYSPATHTSVATAVPHNQSSWGYSDFDYFARDSIAAMAGATVSGGALASNPDTGGDGTISAREAFDYADSIHYSGDDPQYGSSGATPDALTLGRTYSRFLCRLYLEPIYRRWPWPWPPEFIAWRRKVLLPELDRAQKLVDESTVRLDAAVRELAAKGHVLASKAKPSRAARKKAKK